MQDRTLPIQSSQETISGRTPLVYSGGSSSTSPKLTLISWTLTVAWVV